MFIFSFVMSFKLNHRPGADLRGDHSPAGRGACPDYALRHAVLQTYFQKIRQPQQLGAGNVSGIRVVKSFVREEYEKEKFGKASEDVKKGFREGGKNPRHQQPRNDVLYLSRVYADFLFRLQK